MAFLMNVVWRPYARTSFFNPVILLVWFRLVIVARGLSLTPAKKTLRNDEKAEHCRGNA